MISHLNHETLMIASATAHVANAELVLTAAQAEHAPLAKEAQRLASRLATLQAEKQAVADRRLNGDTTDADADLVALLNLDITSLGPLVQIAEVDAQRAQTAVQTAQAHLKTAQAELARQTALAASIALEARTNAIEQALIAAIAELAKLKRTITPGNLAASQIYQISTSLDRFMRFGTIPV